MDKVDAEWSRCPGSMARRPRDSVASLRWSSTGWMPARIGRLSAGVWRRHPVTIRKASLMASLMVDDAGVSTVSSDSGVDKAGMSGTRQERSTLLLNGSGLVRLLAALLLQHPNLSQWVTSGARRAMSGSCEVTQGVGGKCATCPTLLRGIWARSRRAGFRCWSWLSAHVWLPCWRWKTADTVL